MGWVAENLLEVPQKVGVLALVEKADCPCIVFCEAGGIYQLDALPDVEPSVFIRA